jgi:hypothetical protein
MNQHSIITWLATCACVVIKKAWRLDDLAAVVGRPTSVLGTVHLRFLARRSRHYFSRTPARVY